MLNYAARYLEPEVLAKKDHVANAWQEVYLLHYRNLIEFFTNCDPRTRTPEKSIRDAANDLTYLKPLAWSGLNIPQGELMPAVTLARPLYREHFKPISRYLQHCTDWRYALPKEWGYPTMHKKITEVLQGMYAVMARHGITEPPMMK